MACPVDLREFSDNFPSAVCHPTTATRQVEQLESDLKMIAEGHFLQDTVHPYESAPAQKTNSGGACFLFPFDVVHPPTTQVCVYVCVCVCVYFAKILSAGFLAYSRTPSQTPSL